MIEPIKKLFKELEFAPMEYVLPDGKKVYIVMGGEPINTMIFEETQTNKVESEKS